MEIYKKTDEKIELKFVSYTGKYPNLCSGTLTIVLDGKQYEIPRDCFRSGGTCSRANDYRPTYGDWELNRSAFNEDWNNVNSPVRQLIPYLDEIEKLMNENVQHGCCGGCS